MSLDADETKVTKFGRVTVDFAEGIRVDGFEGNKNCSCRDLAVLAMSHAIEMLQRELRETIQKPGGTGICGIG